MVKNMKFSVELGSFPTDNFAQPDIRRSQELVRLNSCVNTWQRKTNPLNLPERIFVGMALYISWVYEDF